MAQPRIKPRVLNVPVKENGEQCGLQISMFPTYPWGWIFKCWACPARVWARATTESPSRPCELKSLWRQVESLNLFFITIVVVFFIVVTNYFCLFSSVFFVEFFVSRFCEQGKIANAYKGDIPWCPFESCDKGKINKPKQIILHKYSFQTPMRWRNRQRKP